MLNRKKIKKLLFLLPLLSTTLFAKGTNCMEGHCFVDLGKQVTVVKSKWKLPSNVSRKVQEDTLEVLYADGTIITVAMNHKKSDVEAVREKIEYLKIALGM